MNGIVKRAGWTVDEDGTQVFRAIVEYPSGPPDGLTFDIIRKAKPVAIVLVPDQAEAAE